MIEQGLGISLLPSWAIREEVKNGKLAQIRFKKNKVRRKVSIISLKGAKTAPIRAFIEYILNQKEHLQKLAEAVE